MLLEPRPYTKDQIDKIGNAIVYLAERIKPLSKTKLLKLVYLIEEISIKKSGIPFFNLRFDVWKLGPVSRDIFIELSSEPVILSEYISIEKTPHDNNIYVNPKTKFCDDEFSNNDIGILNYVVDTFKTSSAQDLIKLTHRKHSPWYLTAKKNNILEHLESGKLNSTDIEIDFTELFHDSPLHKEIFMEHKEFLAHTQYLKS